MTGLTGILVPNVLFVPLTARGFLPGFAAVPRCFLATSSPPLPLLACRCAFCGRVFSTGCTSKPCPSDVARGLATPRSPPSVPSASCSADRWRKSSAIRSVAASTIWPGIVTARSSAANESHQWPPSCAAKRVQPGDDALHTECAHRKFVGPDMKVVSLRLF